MLPLASMNFVQSVDGLSKRTYALQSRLTDKADPELFSFAVVELQLQAAAAHWQRHVS